MIVVFLMCLESTYQLEEVHLYVELKIEKMMHMWKQVIDRYFISLNFAMHLKMSNEIKLIINIKLTNFWSLVFHFLHLVLLVSVPSSPTKELLLTRR